MAIDQQEITEEYQYAARIAVIYHFLASSMDFPDASRLNAVHWTFLRTLLAHLGWHDQVTELPPVFNHPDHLEPLQIEYTRLFINAVPHAVAPPYGSVYLSADGMLYGPSAEKTKAFYRQKGFELAAENAIPDHLVHELRFLALLHEDGRDDVAEQFLDRFFRPWFSHFYLRVVTEARHPYYRILVQLMDFFTREEKKYGC